MPRQAHQFLLFILFVLAPMMTASLVRGSESATPVSTVVAEAICQPATPSPAASPAVMASPSPAAIEFDQIYLDLMISQQQRLLTMALLAESQSQSQEVRELSGQIVAATEPVLQRLKDTRVAWFAGQPVLEDAAIMSALDEIGRSQPAVGGVPGAAEILFGKEAVADLCADSDDFDVHYLTALIDQLDAGVLLSGAANTFAGREETRVIAALVVETDEPLKNTATAYRDALLQGSPIPADH